MVNRAIIKKILLIKIQASRICKDPKIGYFLSISISKQFFLIVESSLSARHENNPVKIISKKRIKKLLRKLITGRPISNPRILILIFKLYLINDPGYSGLKECKNGIMGAFLNDFALFLGRITL